MKKTRKISMIPEFLKNRKTYMLTALVFTIIGVLGLSFAYFRAQTIIEPTNSTVMVETVDIAGNVEQFTVYYDNNDGFFETGILNISNTYTDIMKFRVVSNYSLDSQNISINWKSVTSTLIKENTSYDLYTCSAANYNSVTSTNIISLCNKISPTTNNYLPSSNEKTRLTSADDISVSANTTNYYIVTISIPVSETGKGFDGSVSVKHNVDHLLTLNLNGGTSEYPISMTLGTGDTVTIPGPIKAGFMVSNWTTSCTECQVNGMNFTMGTSDATLTAEWVADKYNYGYTGAYQEFIVPQTGTYKVETWGAQGGTGKYTTYYSYGGYGAYTKGEIYLEKNEKLYIYVGQNGDVGNNMGPLPYNGGSRGGDASSGGGGGATDIRYFMTTPSSEDLAYNSVLGLNSRIMVAAGGGGGAYTLATGVTGEAGGGLQSTTATQTSGGSFGIGISATSGQWQAGSGGGYYSGTQRCVGGCNGSGGTSYIGGHIGCNSIMSNSNRTHSGSALNYSNKYFLNTKMIDGNGYRWTNIKEAAEQMPNPSGGEYSLNSGQPGNGYARISFLNYNKKTINQINNEKDIIQSEYHYSYNGSVQIFTVPQTGTYKVETWGAQGGTGKYTTYYSYGGGGAYTKGEIYLEKNEKLYVYVGQNGGVGNNMGPLPYNGGSRSGDASSGGGGGATDIRYFMTTPSSEDLAYNSVLGLNSRIMVAAGGGGGAHTTATGTTGGAGGGLQSTTATQTSGGSFGIGISATSGQWQAGSGGGYYSGTQRCVGGCNGSGGTSYISGHIGCNSIMSNSNRTHSGSALNYSNKYFLNTKMIDGNGYRWTNIKETAEQMPNPYGNEYPLYSGQPGDGYAKISFLNSVEKSINQINTEKDIIQSEYHYSYSGSVQLFNVPQTGTYKIEAWGTQGGTGKYENFYSYGGYGAYTKGEIYLEKNEKLYIYVGQNGGVGNNMGPLPYNGGSRSGDASSGGGGGATDIRYFMTTPSSEDLAYNSVLGLNSRIMVAAGGGGGAHTTATGVTGEAGGGLQSTTATQTSGGSFGIGISATSGQWQAGSGGGYYSGTQRCVGGCNGSGGTSYISGHAGCLAINDLSQNVSPRTILSGCTSSSKNIECSYHRALTARILTGHSKYFTNTLMIDGTGYGWTTAKSSTTTQMPIPEGGTYAVGVGRSGNGYVRITIVE